MLDPRRIALAALGALVALTLPFGPPVARAEVAVGGVGSGPLRLYIMVSLVDDPEPVGIVWARMSADPSRVVLNEGGQANGDGPPALLAIPGAAPLVSWSQNGPQGYDVVLSRFENGAWTQPEVLANGPADELDPQLFVRPADGSIHLVYWIDGATPRVVHREAPADLSAWTAPVEVSQPGESACRPSGVFHNDVMRVVYETHDLGLGSTPRQIVMATRYGTDFIRQMLAITHHQQPNWPQIHAAGGRVWVDWIDAGDRMAWIRLLSPGWGAVGTEPYQGAGDRDYRVRGTIRALALD